MFIAALLTKTKVWKQSKCSWTDEWIKMSVCVCVCVCMGRTDAEAPILWSPDAKH